MSYKTIFEVVSNHLCVGCGTCVSLCPKNAIELRLNQEKGIYGIYVEFELCNFCGICLKVCPGHEVDFKSLNKNIFGIKQGTNAMGTHSKCYIGFTKDDEIRYSSSSGGFITQLLLDSLESGLIDGALVTRMSEDEPLKPEPFIARTKNEIIDASKSKYCPVPVNLKLNEILNSKDEKFAVVGLPCHIHGFRKSEEVFEELKEKIVIYIGIVCNHTPTFLATEFILKKLKIDPENVQSLDYRGEGWPGKMKIVLRNGDIKKLGDYWGSGFGQLFKPYRCTLCCDHSAELADISVADAWLPEIKKKDKKGSSMIIIRSKLFKNFDVNTRLSGIDCHKFYDTQGNNFIFKKNYLIARMNIVSKIFGNAIPIYHTNNWGDANFISYLNSFYLYSITYLSSKRYLWGFLILAVNIMKKMGDYKK